MSNIFERDYQMLELDRDANWADARASYKRLVNRWHPDRFSSRPREKQHAQGRFIEVTKSYNNLRAFHRLHSRLPLQDPALRDNPQSTGTPPEPAKKPAAFGAPRVEDTLKTPRERPASHEKKPAVWLYIVPFVILAVIVAAVFVGLEKRLKAKQRAAAIEVLNQVQPSEFLPRRN